MKIWLLPQNFRGILNSVVVNGDGVVKYMELKCQRRVGGDDISFSLFQETMEWNGGLKGFQYTKLQFDFYY